jgi:hypothetical protein
MTSSSQHIDFHTIVIEDVQVRSIYALNFIVKMKHLSKHGHKTKDKLLAWTSRNQYVPINLGIMILQFKVEQLLPLHVK